MSNADYNFAGRNIPGCLILEDEPNYVALITQSPALSTCQNAIVRSFIAAVLELYLWSP